MKQNWNLSLDESVAISISSISKSATNLSIFQNCSLKKCIFKIAFSKNALSKLLSKKDIRKIAPSRKTSKKTSSKFPSLRYNFKLAPSKNTFLKYIFLSKNTYSNCSLKKDISKLLPLIFSFNLFFIRIIERTSIILRYISITESHQ